MKLSSIAQAIGSYLISSTGDCEINALSQDSRQQTDRGLFFCISGSHFDAHRFAPQAIQNGAMALVVTRPLPDIDVPQLLVSNDRRAMSAAAAAFYGYPANRLRMIGVTGTKGKTTTSYLIKSVIEHAGYKTGLIGTTGNMIADRWLEGNLTTPDPIDLHRTLAQMADEEVLYVVMEVSAHALDMHRLDGIQFEAGCYTNLSQDHLDYFGTMRKYFEAKKGYFTSGMVRNAALNVDDETTEEIIRSLSIPYSSFGISAKADIYAKNIEISEGGVDFTLGFWGSQEMQIQLKMMGMFNVYNALAAAATCLIIGIPPESIARGLSAVRIVPGRAELLDTHTPYKVILDYSHSPDAMENILKAMRTFTKNRMIVLFGCGGDRDQAKRPMMGRIAGQLADYSIITSDNPRSENPGKILDDIEKGIIQVTHAYERIENRRNAIERALSIAVEGDVIILAGKGHETYQEIAGVKRPFNEKQIVNEILAGFGGEE